MVGVGARVERGGWCCRRWAPGRTVNQVWDNVMSATQKTGAAILDRQELDGLVDAIHHQYLSDPASTWWWNSLRVPSGTLAYGDRDGLSILMDVLPEQSNVTLLVTNESAIPIGAVRGDAEQLHTIIADCPFFEFAIVPASLDWILFDTHHNVLVGAGRLRTLRE